MKILGLLSSNVRGGDANIPRQDLYPARMEGALVERLGEPVTVVARAIWPTHDLPALVGRWMNEEAPDLAMFSVQAYWFLYESMPAQFERFGAPGRAVTSLALKAAATPWLAHNALFQRTRGALQRFVPGRPHFTPEEVIAVSRRSISAMIRREGTYVVVTGPSGGRDWPANDAARARMERRRKVVDTAIGEFCRAHHIEYWDPGMFAQDQAQPRSLQGDRLHLDREGHRQVAARYLDSIVALCQRAQAHNVGSEAEDVAVRR